MYVCIYIYVCMYIYIYMPVGIIKKSAVAEATFATKLQH